VKTELLRIVCGPLILAIAAALSALRWPGIMRRVSRGLAVATGIALSFIIATGWIHRPGLMNEMHRWSCHGLLIVAWSAIPIAIGITSALLRGHPLARFARPLGFLSLLGVLFLASTTGYLGPSSGPYDAMTLRRFQWLHEWIMPSLAIALVTWWFRSLKPARKAETLEDLASPLDSTH
jgi:hypothetical protein